MPFRSVDAMPSIKSSACGPIVRSRRRDGKTAPLHRQTPYLRIDAVLRCGRRRQTQVPGCTPGGTLRQFLPRKSSLRRRAGRIPMVENRGYHAHVYYNAETKPVAAQLREAILEKFVVEPGGFSDEPR